MLNAKVEVRRRSRIWYVSMYWLRTSTSRACCMQDLSLCHGLDVSRQQFRDEKWRIMSVNTRSVKSSCVAFLQCFWLLLHLPSIYLHLLRWYLNIESISNLLLTNPPRELISRLPPQFLSKMSPCVCHQQPSMPRPASLGPSLLPPALLSPSVI